MAIGGAFLGGGVEVVPAGSCKLELEAYTDNATVSATFTITGGGNTYSVTSGTDGRASKVVPSGVTYTVSATVTGYTAPPSQTVIAESSSIKYVRFDAQLKKAQGDISTLQADVDKAEGDISTLKTDVGNAQGDISTLQADVKRAQSTADSKADTTVATQSANGLMSKDDKIKLDGIEDTYATISAVQTAQSTADGKVSKSGDTMTGTLSINNGISIIKKTTLESNNSATTVTEVGRVQFRSASNETANLISVSGPSNNSVYLRATRKVGESNVDANIIAIIGANGDIYGVAPSWSPGTNDNSDKILTIKMANSLPSLVHTSGNESIAGLKTFTSRIVEQKSSDMGIEMLSTSFDRGATFTSYQRPVQFIARDKNGDSVLLLQTYAESNNRRGLDLMLYDMGGNHCELSLKSNGSIRYATAPTTPSDATGTEIATADWSLSKFQRKITYGTGDPPSGGQAGDIYIKI